MNPQALVEAGIAASTADDVVVIVHDTAMANLRWANNTLTTNGVMRSISATAIAFVRTGEATHVGSVSSSASTVDDVRSLVAAATAAARVAAPARDVAPLVGGPVSPDWDEPALPTDISVYDVVAPALGEVFTHAQSASRRLYGFVDHNITTTYLGSSTGLRLRHSQPTGHFACTAKPDDLSQSAWVGIASSDFTDVDPLALADQLNRRLAWGERRIDLPAGRYDTILPPTAVADLLIDAYWSAGARAAIDGQSVYSRRGGGTRVGEQIANSSVQLFSDPHYQGVECLPIELCSASSDDASVFDNGLPLARTEWIRDGRLEALVQSRATAAESGTPSAPFIDNLVMQVDGASGSLEELVGGVERGLLLTCLWYIREVDPQSMLLTGLTRDGVYVIEDGEIVGVANNFRFNESPIDLLNRFTHASSAVRSFSREWGDDYFNRTITPALRIPDFNMSSVSQAL